MTDILKSIDLSQQHIAKFKTLKDTNIYAAYKPNTTIGKLVTEFFNNYSVKNHEQNHFDIRSTQLNKSLFDFPDDKLMSELNLNEISEFVIKIKPEFIKDSEIDEPEHKELVDARQKYKYYKENMNNKTFLEEQRKKFENESIISQLFVKGIDGKTTTIDNLYDLPSNISSEYINVCIEDRLNIPVKQQRIIYQGRQIQKRTTCDEYKITNHVTLHLVIRLCGGMYDETSGRDGNYEVLKTCLFSV
jgi:hypothetical protein